MTERRATDVPAVVSDDRDAESFLLPTGTVTFLLTDVEQSTAAWDAAPEAMAKAISRHYEILGDAVARHHGVRPVEQGEGDSIVAAFSRAADGVAAALEAQQRLGAEAWPDGGRVAVRMALHTGDAQLRDSRNYFGQTVIRTARLRALARGGQVLASRATRDLVADALPGGASWRDLGVHRLKDLGRPEHVFQLEHRDLRDDLAPLRGLDATVNNLPTQLTTFIGRARELGELTSLLDTDRLVTLTGAGGCGKTRLALQAAAERIDRHVDGVWYVELASLAGSGTVARQVADVLGISDEGDGSVTDAVCEHVGERTMLFVVDNCEHLLDDAARMIDTLLRRCPAARVVATSRQALDVPGEVVWRVPSMAVPAPDATAPIDGLAEFDAVRLFCERAERSRAGFALDDHNATTIATICRRVDGIPLALELAAARVRTMGVDDILQGLDDRFHLLSGGARTLLPRQQTLAASVDWSYDLLDARHQQVLDRVAVFAGAFTATAARVVADDAGVIDALTELVDRSLVQLDDTEAVTRYRMLETIKAYGRARLAQSDDESSTRDRHLAYFRAVALDAETGIVGTDQQVWLDRLDHDLDDIRAALEWASRESAFESLLRIVAAIGPYWHARGHGNEAQEWYARALHEAANASPSLRGPVVWASAYQSYYAGDIPLAYERAEQALALARDCGDERTEARALDTIASVRQFSDAVGTQRDFLHAAEIAERAGDTWCQTDALQKAAYGDYYRDRWVEALALEAEAYELAQRLGNRFFLSWHFTLTGCAALRAGRLDDGRVDLDEAFAHAIAIGEPLTIAAAGSLRVMAEISAGDIEAAEHNRDALVAALGDHAADGFGAVLVGYSDARLALDREDPVTAAAMSRALTDALLADDVLFPTKEFVATLAVAHLDCGDAGAARHAVATLRDIAARLQSDYDVGVADLLDAAATRADGRPDLGDRLARAALTTLTTAGAWCDALEALELLGGCVLDLGNATDALRLFAAADTVRTECGWHGRRFHRRPHVERDVAAAREALGGAAADVFAQGAALSFEDAISFAMRARGTRARPSAGWAALTPTERRVADLVAEGRSNPEIAAALLMSRATVKTHVSHVLGKIGVASRAEVAAEVARHEH